MNTIELFKNSLLSSAKHSPVTIRNYISDVNKFIKWFGKEYGREFTPLDFTKDNLSRFINDGKLLTTFLDPSNGLANQPNLSSPISSRSMDRYLSSLRRFATFMSEANMIESNPFQSEVSGQWSVVKKDPWSLKSFKESLYASGVSTITNKNYMVDINAFTSWLDYKFSTNNLMLDKGAQPGFNNPELIKPEIISQYKDVLQNELGLSPSTIERKMSSIRKYVSFGKKNGLIPQEASQIEINVPLNIPQPFSTITQLEDGSVIQQSLAVFSVEPEATAQLSDLISRPQVHSSFPPLRLLQKLATPYFAFENKAASFVAGIFVLKTIKISKPTISTPKWYQKYHNISFVHYLHVAILIIYASIIGGVLFNNFAITAGQNKTLAANVSPTKAMPFQGRLTDDNNNPITTATNVRFMVYSNKTSSGSANLLWQELNNVTPDANGVFSVLLGNGNTCSNSPNGVATTSCAFPTNLFTNNNHLYLGITVENTEELKPRQELANVRYATNSQSLQGLVPITSTGAPHVNVLLALDSSGNLVMNGSSEHKFAASGGQFTLIGQILHLKTNEGSGSNIILEPDDLGFVDIRSPIINDSIKGKIAPGGIEFYDKVAIIATESAVAAFIVSNDSAGGDIFAASASAATQFVIQNNGDISIQNGASIDTLSGGTIEIGNTNATTISLGRPGQKVLLPGYTGQNGILYADFGTGTITQATTASIGLCLISGVDSPSWGSCNLSNITPFQTRNGAIVANNSTLDFLVGGQATTSAAFSITNINSGTPTASVSGNLIVMPNTGLGDAGGKVGIAVANPTHTLQLGTDDAVKTATTTWTVISDARTKKDIGSFTDGLNVISQINPVNFTYNGLGGTSAGTQSIGVIAQDVQKMAPYMINTFDVKLHPNDTNTTKIMDFNPHALFFITINAVKELNSQVTGFAQSFTTQTLKAGTITADSIIIATDSVLIAGQSLQDYIRTIVESETSQLSPFTSHLISPLASISELHTDLISPIGTGEDIKINANVAISGSASVSGRLIANSLQTTEDSTIGGRLSAETVDSSQLTVSNHATISGTLYANNIDGLDRRIIEAYHQQAASMSSSLLASLQNSQFSTLNSQLDIQSISSDFATFRQGLIALAPASFTQASVQDVLSIGTNMIISENSINTLGTDLAFQPLRQGAVDFMAGAVRIETDGTLKVANEAFFAKDVTISGKLKTNRIEPGIDGLIIDGSASVSGGLSMNKLNIFHAQPAYAISETEVVATGSAGMESIKPYRNELTIYNSNVTEKSLIYVSPVGTNYNQAPTLLRQIPNTSFTVGIETPLPSEIKFNWIIIN